MKYQDVQIGAAYLTGSVRVSTAFGPRTTRGKVRVTGRATIGFKVTWLMRDGTERKEKGLPKCLKARQLLAKVPA